MQKGAELEEQLAFRSGWHSVKPCEESGQRDAHNENSERDKYERLEPVSAIANLV